MKLLKKIFAIKFPKKGRYWIGSPKRIVTISMFGVLTFVLVMTLSSTWTRATETEPVPSPAAPKSLAQPTVRSMVWPAYEGAPAETIKIFKNTSQIFRFDRPIPRTAISNPAIVDVTAIGNRDLLVNAKDAGSVNLLVWDNANNIASFNLDAALDLEKINQMFQEIDPASDLNIVPFNNTVAVYGTAETSVRLKQIEEATKAFDKNAVSFARLRESKQILLEVRFAEINRKANREFKLDGEAISRYFNARSFTGQTGSSTNTGDDNVDIFKPTGGPLFFQPLNMPTETHANVFGGFIDDQTYATGFLKWLEQQNILKIIARPNLLVEDGQEGSFVVGGEFPVPLSTQDRITIEYKEFGTKLKFTPEVIDTDKIRLKVETEVSELDFSTTISFGGVTVPSIIKRNHKTVTELGDNQTFVIGGLLTQKVNKIKKRVPLLWLIPIVGQMAFKSEEYARIDVELLVVITPHLVRPLELKEQKSLYDPDLVTDAVRAYKPAYPDVQGDAINKMITQDEGLLQFNKSGKEREAKDQKSEGSPGASVSQLNPPLAASPPTS